VKSNRHRLELAVAFWAMIAGGFPFAILSWSLKEGTDKHFLPFLAGWTSFFFCFTYVAVALGKRAGQVAPVVQFGMARLVLVVPVASLLLYLNFVSHMEGSTLKYGWPCVCFLRETWANGSCYWVAVSLAFNALYGSSIVAFLLLFQMPEPDQNNSSNDRGMGG